MVGLSRARVLGLFAWHQYWHQNYRWLLLVTWSVGCFALGAAVGQ